MPKMEKRQEMGRLIDAEQMKHIVHDYMDRTGSSNFTDIHIFDFLNECDCVDAVEVVRCGKCRYFTEGMAVGMCKRIPDKPIIPMVYDNFCKYGERRSNVYVTD